MDFSSTSAAEAGTGYDASADTHGDFTSHKHHRHTQDDAPDDNHPHHLLQQSSADGAETVASTKYLSYPTDRPFINSDIPLSGATTNTGRSERTVNSYPTSDRDAVISALRNLQDKVKKLELERTEAEHNLHTLASETEQYKEMINQDKTAGKGKQFTFGSYMENGDGYAASQARELEGQLSSAENRCRLLEQQLEHMRTMVSNSERTRRELMERTARARQEKERAALASAAAAASVGAGSGSGVGVGGKGVVESTAHVDRLNELERDQLRLTATQSLAETKIRELEERVKEERIHRRMLQERTAHLESETKQGKPTAPAPPPPTQTLHHAPRIPVTTQTPHVAKKSTGTSSAPPIIKAKKPPKKKVKKKTVPARRPASSSCPREQSRHYRLNLAEIPFVAGKSTSESHSLGANVQKVLAMMKSHNKALCSSHPFSQHNHHRAGSPSTTTSTSSSSGGENTESSGTAQDLGELLGQLQDEFGQLCSNQQEVMTQLHEAHASGDFRRQTDLEAQLDTLVSRMEAKSGQIAKIRQHQLKLESGKKSKSAPAKSCQKSRRPHSANSHPTSSSTTTTTTTNGYHKYSHDYYQNNNINGNMRPKPHSSNKTIGHSALGNPALYMLRDMKKLRSTLRKDDLCWE